MYGHILKAQMHILGRWKSCLSLRNTSFLTLPSNTFIALYYSLRDEEGRGAFLAFLTPLCNTCRLNHGKKHSRRLQSYADGKSSRARQGKECYQKRLFVSHGPECKSASIFSLNIQKIEFFLRYDNA